MAEMHSRRIDTVRGVAALRERIAGWRGADDSVGLVPTMGALHDGHLSLVRRSVADNARTCVTIFVNPKQFAAGEDLDTYPRDEAADRAALAACGADLVYAPENSEIYPDGFATVVSVPGLGARLEGEFRPGFFDGVATVVSKLLLQSLPDRAYFGEKDFQQLRIVERLVADLDIPVTIVGVAIVREADGLALSSRNVYLNAEERRIAPRLYAELTAAAERLRRGDAAGEVVAAARAALLAAGFTGVDYVALCDAAELAPVAELTAPARLLAAAWLGPTRLIDNLAVNPE